VEIKPCPLCGKNDNNISINTEDYSDSCRFIKCMNIIECIDCELSLETTNKKRVDRRLKVENRAKALGDLMQQTKEEGIKKWNKRKK